MAIGYDGDFHYGDVDLRLAVATAAAAQAGAIELLARGERLTASQVAINKVLEPGSRIDVRYNTSVEAFEGENDRLKTVRVRNQRSNQISELHPQAAFLFIGQHPNSEFAKGFVTLDPYGYILTGHDLLHDGQLDATRPPFAFETRTPGVFAAGDVRAGSTKQIASAVGEGAAAALSIREYLKSI